MCREKLGKYYVLHDKWRNTDRLLSTGLFRLDENGILLTRLPFSPDFKYHPVSMALCGLGKHADYLDNHDPRYLQAMLRQAEWLVNNITDKGGFGVWEHYYVLPYYDFNIPWVHGMAQGLGVSLLLRAWQITDDVRYRQTAERALNSFKVNIEDGGARHIDGDGNLWIEEYGIPSTPHILNGFIYALFGAYDFYRATGNDEALILFNQGVRTILDNLGDYDMGYWSRYDLLHRYPATVKYHGIHIKQMEALYFMTGINTFIRISDRWMKGMERHYVKIVAKIYRGFIHLSKHGISGLMRRYIERRKWKVSMEGKC